MASTMQQGDLFGRDEIDPGEVVGIAINGRCRIQTRNGNHVVTVCGLTLAHYAVGDRMGEACAMVSLVDQGWAKQCEVATVFGCDVRTVRRNQSCFWAAVPPPRVHQVRCFGVLSSHASLPPEVAGDRPHDDCADRPPPACGDQFELMLEEGDRGTEHGTRRRWAWLLAHVHLGDVDHCPKCQGPMRWTEVAKTPLAVDRLMARMGMVPEPMPRQPHPPLDFRRVAGCTLSEFR